MDTSWLMEWSGTRLVIDPWLVGSEIDGFKWFNEQWHATEPVSIEDIGHFDAIIISQSYADHCHLNTLKELSSKPIYASPKAANVINGWELPNPVIKIDDEISVGNVQVKCLRPDRRLDPIYYALIFSRDQDAVIYASHGFEPTTEQLEFMKSLNVKLLITTLTEFKLPSFMGGKVNPGMDNARKLVEYLQPEKIINTHDEEKIAKGLVKRLAKVKYPDYDNTGFANFIKTDNYDPVLI